MQTSCVNILYNVIIYIEDINMIIHTHECGLTQIKIKLGGLAAIVRNFSSYFQFQTITRFIRQYPA